MTNVENHADLFFIIFVLVCQSQCSYQTARKRHNSSIYYGLQMLTTLFNLVLSYLAALKKAELLLFCCN